MTNIPNIFISQETDPFFNLAVEHYLLENHEHSEPVLFIYRSTPCVVLGRNQNPWLECNVPECQKRNINVCRRISGGGTVYHDLGNTNFCFITPRNQYDPDLHLQIVVNALKDFSINAGITERHDLEFDGAKISGTAFRLTNKSALQHGTLLLNADLNVLRSVLESDDSGINSHAVKSIKSPVRNIQSINTEINHDSVTRSLVQSFRTQAKPERAGEFRFDKNQHMFAGLNQYREKLADWQWIFGHTPPFSQTLTIDEDKNYLYTVKVEKGVIKEVQPESSALQKEQDTFEKIKNKLIGQYFNRSYVKLGRTSS